MAPERPSTRVELPQSTRQISYDEKSDLSIVTTGGVHHRKQGEWPLSACVVRQIQRQVARAGRSLKRLEVQGTIIDNFESLGPLSPPSPSHRSHAVSVKRESDCYEEEGVQTLSRSIIKREDEYYEEESIDADEPDAVSTNSQIYIPVIKREGRSVEEMNNKNTMNSASSHSRSNHTPLKRELEYDDESIGVEGVNTSEENLNEDNDLTNLTWLQDRNLLRSINLAKGENDELRPMSVQISPRTVMSGASPTSDYLEDSFASEPADSNSSDQPAPSPCPSPAHTPLKNMIPNGFVSSTKSGSASKGKHPYDVPYNPLVHTQNKPPYSFSCLIFMAIEDSPKKALPVKDIYSWILEHFPYFRNAPTGWKNSVRHNLSLNKCFLKVEKLQSLGKGSLWMVDDHYRNNLLQAFSRSPFHPCCPSTVRSPSPTSPPPDTSDSIQDRIPVAKETNLVKGAPDPELFPFLSRRLAATTNITSVDTLKEALSDHDSCDSLDEVVAATMVLALKHGPGVLPPPLISSCPTQDHTYSAATGSPETGYGSDEEQRRTAEALLHLAGLPLAPETTSQLPFKPRLLRRAPKRPAQSASFDPPNCHTINNNCGSQADRNLVRVKRSRQQL